MNTARRVTPHIVEDYAELMTPGVHVSLSPAQADAVGAFQEDALSEADAWASHDDAAIADDEDEPEARTSAVVLAFTREV